MQAKIREINLASSINMLSFIFGVDKNRIETWIEKENLVRRIRQVATDSAYLKDIVNGLKNTPRSHIGLINMRLKSKNRKFYSIL